MFFLSEQRRAGCCAKKKEYGEITRVGGDGMEQGGYGAARVVWSGAARAALRHTPMTQVPLLRGQCYPIRIQTVLLQGTPATGPLHMSNAAGKPRNGATVHERCGKKASQKVIARGAFARRYCRAAQDFCWLPVIARGAFARFARRHCRRRRPRKKRPQPKGHTWTTSFFL